MEGYSSLCVCENALALERQSRVLNGHEEWPENILQASVNPTISEIIAVVSLIYRKVNCNIQRNSAAFVLAVCARKRSKLQ